MRVRIHEEHWQRANKCQKLLPNHPLPRPLDALCRSCSSRVLISSEKRFAHNSKILVTEEITIVKGVLCQHLGHNFCSRFPRGHFCNEFFGRFGLHGVVFVADFFGVNRGPRPSVDSLASPTKMKTFWTNK